MEDVADLLVQGELVLALPSEAADAAGRAGLGLGQERLDLKGDGVEVVLLPLFEVVLEQPVRLHVADLVDDLPPAAIRRMFVHAAAPHVLIPESVRLRLCQPHALPDLLPLEEVLVEALQEDLREGIVVGVLGVQETAVLRDHSFFLKRDGGDEDERLCVLDFLEQVGADANNDQQVYLGVAQDFLSRLPDLLPHRPFQG